MSYEPINIEGIPLPRLLACICSIGRPLGLGVLAAALEGPLTERDAKALIENFAQQGFSRKAPDGEPVEFACDYVRGIPVKGTFTATKWFRHDLFDRDAGDGAAARAVAMARETAS